MGQAQTCGLEDLGNQQELEGRYFIQKVKLGSGSHGSVWRAVDRVTEHLVAVKHIEWRKLVQKGEEQADEMLKHVIHEVKVMQSCKHENIVQLLRAFRSDHDDVFICLEYCEGGDFGDKLRQRGCSSKEPEVKQWMRDILAAISYLHSKQICHRDIKPDNFLLRITRLKLSDFGLAVSVKEGQLLTERCGTPAFMSPEQHMLPPQGLSAGYSHPVDIWAAGLTMYCLLFHGKHPFVTEKGELNLDAACRGHLSFPVSSYRLFGRSKEQWSADAVDLCQRLARTESQKRILAEDALSHRFLGTLGSPIQKRWLGKIGQKWTSLSSPDTAEAAISKVDATDSIPTKLYTFEIPPPQLHPPCQRAKFVHQGQPLTAEDLVSSGDASAVNTSDIETLLRAEGPDNCCGSGQIYYIGDPVRALRIGGKFGCLSANIHCSLGYPPPCVNVIEPTPKVEQQCWSAISTQRTAGISSSDTLISI